MECILLSSKPKTNAVEKEKEQECNNDNDQRLVWVFADATEIQATQTEPYLHWIESCFSHRVFSTAELKLNLKSTVLPTNRHCRLKFTLRLVHVKTIGQENGS